MRAVATAFVILVLAAAAARAEDMVASNQNGIMCRDEKVLAEVTAPDGTEKQSVMANPYSPANKPLTLSCQGIAGATVHVVTRRKNTSIVTYNGQTWYVPNINFFTPSADCLKDGAHVTMAGTIESAFAQTDEVDPKKGYHYPRLTLDKPVCFIGNIGESAGRYVSLPATSTAGAAALMRMVGRHVTITGIVGSPDNGNQPPDNMMMFDPMIKPVS